VSGFQEILVVAVIVLAIVFIPRMRAGRRIERKTAPPLSTRLTGKFRLAVAGSFVYPALAAAFLQPWKGNPIRFVYIGLGPVVLAWLLYWVLVGFKNRK